VILVTKCNIRKRNKRLKVCEQREKKRKSFNANNTLCIYNSSDTLESFPMLRCTIQILSYDPRHRQCNSLSVQPHHISRRHNTSGDSRIMLHYAPTISPLSPRLPTSPPFHNTILSTPSETSSHYYQIPSYFPAPS
jgi:hypothetical protein